MNALWNYCIKYSWSKIDNKLAFLVSFSFSISETQDKIIYTPRFKYNIFYLHIPSCIHACTMMDYFVELVAAAGLCVFGFQGPPTYAAAASTSLICGFNSRN